MSEKCPSSIQCGGSNPQPLGRESPPVTTSKRLPKHWAYLRESNIFVKNWFGKKRGRFWLKSRTGFTNYFGKNFREFRAQLFLQLTSKVLFFLFFLFTPFNISLGPSLSVWPDWAIFASYRGKKILKKQPKYFATFWAILTNITF